VVVSAIEPRPHRRTVLRLYNASPRPRTITLRWNGSGTQALERVDLMERTQRERSEATESSRGSISLRPWEITTLRTC
jgi:alpha-mannosidase